MENMEYELMDGKRHKSVDLYVIHEKQLYKIKSKTTTKTYYICYKSKCPARLELISDGMCMKPRKAQSGKHNHLHQEDIYKQMKSIATLRNDCLSGAGVLSQVNAISGIRTAFRNSLQQDENATKYLNYNRMKRGLQKLTNKMFVKSPKTPLEVVYAFQKEDIWNSFGVTNHNDPLPFYKACIQEDNFAYCIFSSQKIISYIKQYIPPLHREFLMDATFKVVPQGCFKQVLIIYINYFNEKKKTTKAYQHLFEYIDKNIFMLEPNSFITDYEPAQQTALKSVYPHINIQGCWFHYCQALRRCLTNKNKKLAEFIRKNKKGSIFFHKCLALPLLPKNTIAACFAVLKEQIRSSFTDNTYFEPFFKYFEDFWLKKVTPGGFCVHKKAIRTTSEIEAYNRILGRMISKNGNFFKFVKALKDEEFLKSRDMQMHIESGGAIGGKRSKLSSQIRNEDIGKCTEMFDQGKINAMQFLERVTYPGNSICYDMEPQEDLFEEFPSDHSEEEEEHNEEPTSSFSNMQPKEVTCIVCFHCKPNIVLMPCKHLQICSECNLRLQAQSIAEGHTSYCCPMCRQKVDDSMQVYF